MTTLVDNFGGTLPMFVLAIFEIIAIFYFYGLENVCIDMKFMTGRKVTFYWRICWLVLAPLVMSVVYIYSSIMMKPLTYSGLNFPTAYLIIGWSIFGFAMLQLPMWFIWHWMQSNESASTAFVNAFKCTRLWGPRYQTDRSEWMKYREEMKQRARIIANTSGHSKLRRRFNLAFGRY